MWVSVAIPNLTIRTYHKTWPHQHTALRLAVVDEDADQVRTPLGHAVGANYEAHLAIVFDRHAFSLQLDDLLRQHIRQDGLDTSAVGHGQALRNDVLDIGAQC